MAQLADTLEAIKRRELAPRLDAGEAEVLATTKVLLRPAPASFDEQTRSDLQPWLAWTTQASCRHAPAKPFVVAQFIREQAVNGCQYRGVAASGECNLGPTRQAQSRGPCCHDCRSRRA